MTPKYFSKIDTVNKNIIPIIIDLVELIKKIDGIKGILLAGSTSRGEESYLIKDEQQFLLSDIETIVVIEKLFGENNRLRDCFEFINSKYGYLFYNKKPKLEFSTKYLYQIKYADRRFYNFELKFSGLQLFGDKDYLKMIPLINISNLNYAELNTILIHRLISVANNLLNEINILARRYTICRNLLDIPTIILPYEGHLLCGYKKRIESLVKIKNSKLFNHYFNFEEFKCLMEYCLGIKKNPSLIDFNYDEHIMIKSLMEYFALTKRYLEHINKGRCFCLDKRGIIRAIIKKSYKLLLKELLKPKYLEMLYGQLEEILYKISKRGDASYLEKEIAYVNSIYENLF